MTKDYLISIINEDLIEMSNKEEFKNLLLLKNEYAEQLLKINSKELKRRLLLFFFNLNNKFKSSQPFFIFSKILSVKETNIENLIELINSLYLKNYNENVTKEILLNCVENEELIIPITLIINNKELSHLSKNYTLEAINTIESSISLGYNVLKSHLSLITNHNIIRSKHFLFICKKLQSQEIASIDSEFLINSSLDNEKILSLNNYKEIFNKVIELKTSNKICTFGKILTKKEGEKEFLKKYTITILEILKNTKVEFLELFKTIAINSKSFVSDSSYIKALEGIQYLNKVSFASDYYDIVTDNLMQDDSNYETLIKSLNKINNINNFHALKEIVTNREVQYSSHLEFLIEKYTQNLNPVHYFYPSLDLVINEVLLELPNYPKIIDEIHKINSEYILEKLVDIIDLETWYFEKSIFCYLITILDEKLIYEYYKLLQEESLTFNEQFSFIFETSKKIKIPKILEGYKIVAINLTGILIDNAIFKYILTNVSKLTEESKLDYLIDAINLLKTNNEEQENWKIIIHTICKIDIKLLNTYYNIIFNNYIMTHKNKINIILTLSNITSKEHLLLIESFLDNKLGNTLLEKILLIKDISQLKYVNLIIKDLNMILSIKTEEKLEFLSHFIDNYENDYYKVIKRLLKSNNQIILKNKEKLYKLIMTSKTTEELKTKINKEVFLSKKSKDIINELLFEKSIFPTLYPILDAIETYTKEELLKILEGYEKEREIQDTDKVNDIFGPLTLHL